jgi:FkbM family methyltransferase
LAIDIGANHGVFCLPMAQIARNGSVWAFEPASTTEEEEGLFKAKNDE